MNKYIDVSVECNGIVIIHRFQLEGHHWRWRRWPHRLDIVRKSDYAAIASFPALNVLSVKDVE